LFDKEAAKQLAGDEETFNIEATLQRQQVSIRSAQMNECLWSVVVKSGLGSRLINLFFRDSL
jgi:hypothetical protein